MVIANVKPIREIPNKGGGGAVITARFTLAKDAPLTSAQIKERIAGAEADVKIAIRGAVNREYNASGLKKDTRRLITAALNKFTVKFFVRGLSIVVEAEWPASVKSDVPYFFAHLFGATITPRRAKALAIPQPGGGVVFVSKVVIPRRNFIRFDKSARDQTKAILENRLQGPPQGPEPEPVKQPPTGAEQDPLQRTADELAAQPTTQAQQGVQAETVAIRAVRGRRQARTPRLPRTIPALRRVSQSVLTRAAKALRGKRVTPFRLRAELRGAGLSDTEARQIADDLIQRGLTAEQVQQVLSLGRENLLNLAGVVKLRLR